MTFFKVGFSFEAGGRAYRPFVSQSTSGTFYFCCPFSFNILLFKNNLSELQPCLRNAGNGISECFVCFKNFLGGMPPETPRCPLRRLESALWRQDKFHVRCFHNHVRYFTKLLKTLLKSENKVSAETTTYCSILYALADCVRTLSFLREQNLMFHVQKDDLTGLLYTKQNERWNHYLVWLKH